MEFKEYKEMQILALRESVEFLSNKGRKERELWVVKEFLRTLGLEFYESELNSPTEDPPDVTFRGANFEVTELMDEDRTRHKEFKERLERLEAAQSYNDVLEHEDWHREALSPEEILKKVEERLEDKNYSADFMANIDVLVYVNPVIKNYIDKKNLVFSISEDSRLRQWRSVSLLFNGRIAYVLFTSAGAPRYIQAFTGQVIKLS